MIDILGLDSLFAELITALGLALLIGNGFAWWKHRQGRQPTGVGGQFRQGRVVFLLAVGVLMTVWGVASLVATDGAPG